MMFPTALYTDHYQLTQAFAAWRGEREMREGSMEFFCRSMPPTRRYLVAAGLHRVIELLQNFALDDQVLRYMRHHSHLGVSMGKFPGFMKWAKEQKFDDITVNAIPEGEIFFPNEPVLRLSGKLPLLQVVETAVLSILNHDVAVASKAARIAEVAEGKKLFEFGMRRTSLFDSPFAASAAIAAGFDATSNVAAGHYIGLPTVGTMAHSYVQMYGAEYEFQAFCNFLISFAHGTALLIDTFDVRTGTLNAIAASKATGVPLTGVRVDSGDPCETVPLIRELLNQNGMHATDIIVSNDMDEYKIAALPKDVLAKIDAFGIGTQVVNPSDGHSLGFVGKLVEFGWGATTGEATIKLSQDPAKTTWPYRKQVVRKYKLDPDTQMYVLSGDTIMTNEESFAATGTSQYGTHGYGYTNKPDIDLSKEHKKEEGTYKLLDTVLTKAKESALFNVGLVSQRIRARRLQLPKQLRSITPRQPGEDYPVEFSPTLKHKRNEAIKKVNEAVEKAKTRYNK